MNRSPQFAWYMICPGSRRAWGSVLFVAILACAGSMSLLHAQNPTPAPAADQAAPATLPAAPSLPRTAFSFGAATSASVSGLDFGTSAFGRNQNQTRAPVFPRGTSQSSLQGSRFAMDPFQTSPGFGNFTGYAGIGFDGTDFDYGTGRQSVGGFNQLGVPGTGGRQDNLSSLFPTSTLGAPFGAAPLAVPSFSQLMRKNSLMPLNTPPSGFRFSYQDALLPGGTFGDLGRPSTSVLFSSSGLGNGMFFTAGTGYGTRSTAGAPVTGFGNGTAGQIKHSGPAVNLKLSF